MTITTPHYRRRLPHIEPIDRDFFLTYRLAHSIPVRRILELEALLRRGPHDQEHSRLFVEWDRLLELNGPYHLRDPRIRSIIMDSLHFLEREEWHLWAYCVMPNHVHACCRMRNLQRHLYEVMQSHKSFTARQCNKLLGLSGPFWYEESFDHICRFGKLGNAIRYTLQNPVVAGFVKHWREWPGTYLASECHGFE